MAHEFNNEFLNCEDSILCFKFMIYGCVGTSNVVVSLLDQFSINTKESSPELEHSYVILTKA